MKRFVLSIAHIAIMVGWGLLLNVALSTSGFSQKNVEARYAEDYEKITQDGAWCWFSDPRAIYVDDKMIGGFVDKEGSIWAFSYDPATQEKKQYKLHDKLDYDDHANPSVMQLPDKRVVIFFSAHGGTKNSPIYYAVSRRPADITAWEEIRSIEPKMEGNLGVCYTNPAMLSAENNRTYIFFRGRNFKPTFVYSDDLKTWSDPTTFVVNDTAFGSYGRPYMKVTTNHKDKIFFAFTDAHPRDRATNSIYFMMYKDGKLLQADGQVISDDLQKAVSPSMADKVYDASISFDKAWIWDVAFDKDENPVIVYARFGRMNGEHSYWYARWNGKKWENHLITKAGQWFQRADYVKEKPEYECNYSGGVYLDHEDPRIVYTSRPINDVFEIEKWTFTGGKEKWATEAITRQSSRDNVRPFVVRNHQGDQPSVLWMYNYKYPGFKAYDCAIRVNQEAKGYDASFSKESIEKVSNAVFDWQERDYNENKWSDNAAKGWRNGVLYNGLYDWADYTGSKKYYSFLKKICSDQAFQPGKLMYHADDLCVSQVYLDMYVKEKNKNMLAPTLARVDWVLKNPPAENIDITKGRSDRWWWCDALYMAPGVYTRLYAITGDKKYMKFSHKEFIACYDHLYSKGDSLFYRDAKYFTTKENNGEKVFWSRGNGWVMGGLAEVLKTLPANDKKYRPFYLNLFREMSYKLATLQGADGTWSSSLLDPKSYPAPETSGTALNVYAIAYGINQGYLPRETFMPVVKKGWEALVRSVDTEGKLCWVQLVAQKPGTVEKHMTQVYAVGSFLSAAVEVSKLLGGN